MEIWKIVPEYPMYEVSNIGRVRRGSRVLAGSLNDRGYRKYGLSINGKTRLVPAAHLVLSAFVGPRPPGMESGHINGVRDDNRPENLVWVTHLENIRHKFAHGTMQRGEAHGGSKLTDEAVVFIRTHYGRTWTGKQLAAKYGIGRGHLGCVARGYDMNRKRLWSHLPSREELQRRKPEQLPLPRLAYLKDSEYTWVGVGNSLEAEFRNTFMRAVRRGLSTSWDEFQNSYSLFEELKKAGQRPILRRVPGGFVWLPFSMGKRAAGVREAKGYTEMPNGRYKAQIRLRGRVVFLGYFGSREEAMHRYRSRLFEELGNTTLGNFKP